MPFPGLAPRRSSRGPIAPAAFTESGGDRVLGMIKPIENQPSAPTPPATPIPEAQRILGVIDVNLSLASRR